MSDASPFGFGKFIPGFDFLQGLAQSAGSATARPLGRLPEWVAPTVSIEEVDKRITELKAVQFWLEQNGKALAATIQALEVQRMTLSTLKGMNVSMGELAQAFQFPAGMAAGAAAGAAKEGASDHSDWPMSSAGRQAPKKEQPAPSAQAEAAPPPAEPKSGSAGTDASQGAPAQAAMGQAMQWWGALTQQFQQIAAKAMAEPMSPEAVAAAQRATGMAGDFAKAAMERMAAQTGAFAAQAANAPAAAPQPAAARKAADAKQAAPAARKRPAAKSATPAKGSAKAPAAAGKAVRKPAATGRKAR